MKMLSRPDCACVQLVTLVRSGDDDKLTSHVIHANGAHSLDEFDRRSLPRQFVLIGFWGHEFVKKGSCRLLQSIVRFLQSRAEWQSSTKYFFATL